jgi:hypothetical protein
MDNTFHYQTDGWLSARCAAGQLHRVQGASGRAVSRPLPWALAHPPAPPPPCAASPPFPPPPLPTHPPPSSANIYEFSTESLFFGRQDAMQRTALLAVHEWLAETGRCAWGGGPGGRGPGTS